MKIFESIPVEKPNSFLLKEINTPEDLRKFHEQTKLDELLQAISKEKKNLNSKGLLY